MLADEKRAAPDAGFSLIELVIVIVIVGIISASILIKSSGSTSEVTLPSQAEKMAADIRHVQTLASTWSRSLRISINTSTSTYSVGCVTSGTAPCATNPVTDPATGSSFSITLQNSVGLAGTATLDFSSLGKPGASGGYTLTSGSSTATVCVAAVTGQTTVYSTATTCP